MPDLSKISEDDIIQTTFFAGMCESAKVSPYIHPEEAMAVVMPCSGRGRLNIVTCQDDARDEDEADVGGLNMMNVKLRNSGKALPDFIPIIPRGMFKYPGSEIQSGTVGVVLNDILTPKISSKCGRYRVPEGSTLDQSVLSNQAFQGKRVILFSTGPDVLIETLWWERHQKDIFKTIAGMGFAAVTGINFSIINGECPFAHALNIKKSICYCEELDKLDVWTIPHIYAINNHQRERWKNWLLANPLVQIVTINSQLQRKQKQGMNEVFKTARLLLENTSVEIIIHGSPKGLAGLGKKFGRRLHFAASGPLKRAIIRKDKTPTEHINAFRHSLHRMVSLAHPRRRFQSDGSVRRELQQRRKSMLHRAFNGEL